MSGNQTPKLLCSIEKLDLRYGEKYAVQAISVSFDAGMTYALVGPNGSGKTSVLQLIANLVKPSSGSVTWSVPPRIGYVGQHQHQHRWMPLTVSEVVTIGRYRERGLIGRLDASDRRHIESALERLEISGLANSSYGTLSGGQKQRVLLASALASEPTVILLDEPITGLDLPSQQLILSVIDSERDAGKLVLLSTHHLEEAQRCDRVLLLKNRLVSHGAPATVLTEENLATTFGVRFVNVADSDAVGDFMVVDDHGHGMHH